MKQVIIRPSNFDSGERTFVKLGYDYGVIGIDNGVSGALCYLSPHGKIISYLKMPVIKTPHGNEIDVCAISEWMFNNNAWNATMVIEKPCGSKSAMAAKSMAASYASIYTMFRLRNQVLNRISARDWQKPLLKCASGDTKPAALKLAKTLWPDETFLRTERCTTPDDGIIDAALIAHYILTK